jgi:uncharacterized alkaline shock family protein YloU
VTRSVSITEQVISSIAGVAASDVEGVSGLRGNVADNLKAFLGDEGRRRGVVAKEEEGSVHITLHVAIEYGFPIHEVAQNLQEVVTTEVHTMTGLHVSGVDVYVSDLTIPQEDEPQENGLPPGEEEVEENEESED